MNQHTIPSELLQDSLMSGLDIGIVICDENDMVEWANPFICDLLSVSYDEINGIPMANLLDIDPLLPTNSSYRIKVKRQDNAELWFACVQNQSQDNNGETKCVRYFIDISDLQRRQPLRLAVSNGYENSRLDPVSGVFNRKAIVQELNTQISRSRRYGNPLSVILLQHSMPSSIQTEEHKESLQSIASCINSNLRWVDIVGSLAPGQFLIVLPESNAAAAEQACKKINDAILDVTTYKDQLENDYQTSYSDWQQDNNADEMIQRLEASLNQKVA